MDWNRLRINLRNYIDGTPRLLLAKVGMPLEIPQGVVLKIRIRRSGNSRAS